MADAELVNIIRQMLDKGMPAEQISNTLEEMGIPDAKNLVFSVANGTPAPASSSSQQQSEAPAAAQAPQRQSLFSSSTGRQPALAPVSSSGENEWKEAQHEMPAGPDLSKWEQPGRMLTTEEKLDEILALLKALEMVNRRILETDRDVLLRIKK